MLKAAAALALFTACALAGESLDVGSLAGVYKHRFRNSQVDGPDFTSENVLEIVKLPDGRAYFRTHLEFYNGHTCDLSGVASAEGARLVYREHTDQDRDCVFTIAPDGGSLVLGDADNACKLSYCGMRGRFIGAVFDKKSRRTIRYMKRLLASPEYAEALEQAGLKPPSGH